MRVFVDRVAFELHLALPFVGRGGVARACARADEQHVERLWWLEIGILQPRWWCAQRMRSEWVVHARVCENERRVLVVGGWRLATHTDRGSWKDCTKERSTMQSSPRRGVLAKWQRRPTWSAAIHRSAPPTSSAMVHASTAEVSTRRVLSTAADSLLAAIATRALGCILLHPLHTRAQVARETPGGR